MTGTRARPPAGSASPSRDGPDLTHQEAANYADYIASMLEGLRQVAQNAQMPFLAYLVALEEANNEKTNRD